MINVLKKFRVNKLTRIGKCIPVKILELNDLMHVDYKMIKTKHIKYLSKILLLNYIE